MLLLFLAGQVAPATALPQDASLPQTQPASIQELRCPLDRPYDENNPFARIMRGELDASWVYEDGEIIVIMPLEWDHPGHALVIPKSNKLTKESKEQTI